MDNAKLVKQYNAQLQSGHLNCAIEGDELGLIKENIQRLLGGGCRFDAPNPGGATATILVYHPSFDGGKTPIGWIASLEVPEHMSIRTVAEKRLAA